MVVRVLANLSKRETLAALPQVAKVSRRLGIGLCAEAATAQLLGRGCSVDETRADAALVLGGDGSVLHAVRRLGGTSLPVVCLNTGTLGFMACADVSRLDETLLALRDGGLVPEPRHMIQAAILRDGRPIPGIARKHALNDIVVTRGDTGRILSLDLSIDGAAVTSYLCDGLIVATPTGSTAYSLSAGGPILSPRTHAVVVSVICPHSLSSRPLVLPDTATLEIRVRRAAIAPLVSADGQDDATLPVDATLRISRSPRTVRLLRFPERDEFSVLRQKLGWSGSAR